MRTIYLVLLASIILTGCSSQPLWEVSVLNMTDAPIKLKTEKRNSTEIESKRPLNTFSVKTGQNLKIVQGGQVIEEYPVGTAPLHFEPEKDGKILLIVGGPSQLLVADYTDFYQIEGEAAPKDPQIKLVANLREKQSILIGRGDKLSWPHQPLAITQVDGGGFKDRRFLRVVTISEDLQEDKFLEYLKFELDAELKEAKAKE